ncbi:MAG: hypothetical protein ACLFRP_01150 [Puniceicoccaceae bacterium]
MNRSLLLIVCDFLLLSLLALAEFEKSGQPVAAERAAAAAEDDPAEDDSGMTDLLAAALAAEQSSQSEMEEELEKARERLSELEADRTTLGRTLEQREEALAEQAEALAAREAALAEARAQAETVAAEKAEAEERAAALRSEREELARSREALLQEKESLAATSEQLAAEAETSRGELLRREEELARLQSALAERSRRMAELERRSEAAEAEKQRMATEAEAARREKELLAASLESARQTISLEREEKGRLRRQTETLTEGVGRLATASSRISEEVRNLRPVTANEIFRSAIDNRVTFVFEGTKSGLFGDNPLEETVDTVVTRVNGRAFVWLHVSQTPFADPERRKFLRGLDLYLEGNGTRFRVPQLGILPEDRSILFLPIPDEIAERLAGKEFEASESPFRFEDLVVVDLPESRYGETGFRIQPDRPRHIEVDHRIFSSLFGEFSPSAGDLAFTRTGRFLGIVTRGGEAWMAGEVGSGGTINFGERFSRSDFDALP